MNRARSDVPQDTEVISGIEVLLAHCLKLRKEDLFAHPESSVGSAEEKKFWGLFKRFLEGEPLGYLIKKREFFRLDFYINDNVLVPRPETELLVEKALEEAGRVEGKVRILDIGTGSGCIAIALARNLERCRILAVDVSEDALMVAKRNVAGLGVLDKVELRRSDLMGEVDENFDIIVANLPYIGDKDFVDENVRKFEPRKALFGGDDGLRIYERLFREIAELEEKPGIFIGEFGFGQENEIEVLLNKYFIQNKWLIEKDYSSIKRFFVVNFRQ